MSDLTEERMVELSGEYGVYNPSVSVYDIAGTFTVGELIRLLSELRRRRELDQWRDIKDAPKDGTVIDLLVDGERIPNCRWQSDDWMDECDRGWEAQYSEAPSCYWPLSSDQKPTHFRFPPSPPTEQVDE